MKIDKKTVLAHILKGYIVLSIVFCLPLQVYAHNCGAETKTDLNLSPSSIKKSQDSSSKNQELIDIEDPW